VLKQKIPTWDKVAHRTAALHGLSRALPWPWPPERLADLRLEELAPLSRYEHNRTGEDNGDAHHKRQIMGREVVVAVTKGRLDFGTWERIFYGEFDGRRKKRVLVKVIGE
jgi:secondary thiamine-phosphate synthase enzyme